MNRVMLLLGLWLGTGVAAFGQHQVLGRSPGNAILEQKNMELNGSLLVPGPMTNQSPVWQYYMLEPGIPGNRVEWGVTPHGFYFYDSDSDSMALEYENGAYVLRGNVTVLGEVIAALANMTNLTVHDSLQVVGAGYPNVELPSPYGTNRMTSTNIDVRSLILRDYTNVNRLFVQTETGEVGNSPVKVTGSEPDSLLTWGQATQLVRVVQTTGGTNLLRALLPGVTNLHFAPVVLDFSDTNLGWVNWDQTATNTISLLLTNPVPGATKLVRLAGNTNLLAPVDCAVTLLAAAGLGMEWPLTNGVPATNLVVGSNTVVEYVFRCWNTNLVTVDWQARQLVYMGRGHEPPGSSSLLTGLQAYWNMDEASGTRYDLVGTSHLLVTGAVASVAGIITNAVAFDPSVGAGMCLGVADNAAVRFGNSDFTVSVWVYPTNNEGSTRSIVSKGLKNGTTNEFHLYLSAGDVVAAVNTPALIRVYGPTLELDAWSHIVAWYVASTHFLYLRVNNGITYSRDTEAPIIDAFEGSFWVGSYSYNPTQSGYTFAGHIDELAKWPRVLTGDEQTTLYNTRAALPYPFDLP